ncbi:MAG: tetratricopeptide repeat protein [Roseibacillus sp.]
MAPAKTAVEWTERLERDLEKSYRTTFEELYPELPPQEEWESLFALIKDKKAKNRLGEVDRRGFKTRSQLFVALLKEEQDQAQELSRKLLEKERDREWSREERARMILALSKNPEEGLAWLKENHPKVLEPRKPYSHTKSEKDPWDKELADGNIQEGIALLWEEDRKRNKRSDRLSALNHLIKLGQVLPDEELANRAAKRITALLKEEPKEEENRSYMSFYTIRPWIHHQAAKKEWQSLADFSADFRERQSKRRSYSSRNSDLDSLDLLVTFYLDGEESFLEDLSYLLETNTLEKVIATLDYTAGEGSESLNALAIKSLAENDQADLAKNLSLYLLARNSGKDHYYEQLRTLDPDLFAAFLPKLLSYDPFEERPLIWQAELSLAANKLDEAKSLVEKAIELDPSDGDQGKETRMKCYHVLARILEKQGDQEKADFFFDVVKSIREGEAADDYLYAGLIKEATERYRAALGRFEDAYCLQSRLAMTLARNGKFDEAVPHFEKAFELMPVSFGPRESHCLGCEGIFSDERVQTIAERMLAKFMLKNPANPRAPYLLGMVLEEMKDNAGAIKAYQKAFQLDPKYYNCAKRLEALLQKDPEHFGEHQKLLKQMLTIAPYWQLKEQFSKRTDLKQAWLDASQVGPSPLELPPLPVKEEVRDLQFSTNHSYSYQSGRVEALDGWTVSELLRGNDLLDTIDGF